MPLPTKLRFKVIFGSKSTVKNLGRVEKELTRNATETARRLKELNNNVEEISLILRLSESLQDAAQAWTKINATFTSTVGDLRHLSYEGAAQIRNTLDTVSICLKSTATDMERNQELRGLLNLLKDFAVRANKLLDRFADIHRDIATWSRNLLDRPESQEVLEKVSAVEDEMGQLIDREISLDSNEEQRLNHSFGILKALFVFLPPKVYHDLEKFIGSLYPLEVHTGKAASKKRSEVRFKVLDNFLNVGRLLAEDIEGLQPSSSPVEKQFKVMNDLYSCLAQALDRFHLTVVGGPGGLNRITALLRLRPLAKAIQT